MKGRRIHYYYTTPALTFPVYCQPVGAERWYRPGQTPQSSMDPSAVTCTRCRRKLARLAQLTRETNE